MKNTPNKYDPRIGSCPWFFAWFFGGFYFFYKGLPLHGFIWFAFCWTFVVPLGYIIMARELVFQKMIRTGELD